MALTSPQVPPLVLPPESKEETTTPEATPRTHREREDGTSRLKETLGRLRTLTGRTVTSRPSVVSPTLHPPDKIMVTFKDGSGQCELSDLHQFPALGWTRDTPREKMIEGLELMKEVSWTWYHKMLIVIKRGYLIREEMEDTLLLDELKRMKVVLRPPPFSKSHLVALPWKRLVEWATPAIGSKEWDGIPVEFIDPSRGRVIGIDWLTEEKLDPTVAIFMKCRSVESLGCPMEHQLFYSALGYKKPVEASTELKEWLQERGVFVPSHESTTDNFMTPLYTGEKKEMPYGYYFPVIHSLSIDSSSDKKKDSFVIFSSVSKSRRRECFSDHGVMSSIVVLDDHGYPLTSPMIPRFG